MNAIVRKSRGQSPFFTHCGSQPKVSSTELQHAIPVSSDPALRHYSVAEKLNSAKDNQIKYDTQHRRPAKCHEKADKLMLSTKNLPADEFKLSNLLPKWIGPLKGLQYNHRNQHVTLDFTDVPELSNIRNKFDTTLLKPFIPNDDIRFP